MSVGFQKRLVDAVLSHFFSQQHLNLFSGHTMLLNYADYHLQISKTGLLQGKMVLCLYKLLFSATAVLQLFLYLAFRSLVVAYTAFCGTLLAVGLSASKRTS
jgi:hypothetical protein